jgi:hypothetical protein
VLFHEVSLWSYSMGSVFGLIPWGQYLILFNGVSLRSYSMRSVFGLIPCSQ